MKLTIARSCADGNEGIAQITLRTYSSIAVRTTAASSVNTTIDTSRHFARLLFRSCADAEETAMRLEEEKDKDICDDVTPDNRTANAAEVRFDAPFIPCSRDRSGSGESVRYSARTVSHFP
jgi:hypothetical protein